ncbi:hypothetical protein BH11PSE10_BH11PSE10_17530 [soil metagenome]
MLVIDVLTAYAICGAGSLVGACTLQLADSPRPESVAALRMCTAALVVLGLSLLGFAAMGLEPDLIGQQICAAGCLVSMVLWAWGTAMLAGTSVRAAPMWALIAISLVVPAVSPNFGPLGLARAFSVTLAVHALIGCWLMRSFLTDPPDAVARVLGYTALAVSLSSVARAGWTLAYEGAPLFHLLHVPPSMQAIFATFYGVLPLVFSTMILLMVNAELRTRLSERAATDELTGALTRRALREQAQEYVAQARRGRLETAVLMLDLDHFKLINDRHGHATGDVVLRHAAGLWRDALRADSLLARFGGEEFVALVPVKDLRAARLIAERLRNAIDQAPWPALTRTTLRATTSVGVTLVLEGETLDASLQRADEALYRAKREGRNQVQAGLAAA